MTARMLLLLAAIAGVLLGAPAGPAAATVADTGKYYVVGAPVDGQREYLFAIALRTLGDGNRYPEIVELNRGRPQPDGGALQDATDLHPGWFLILPADAKGSGVRTGPIPAFSAAPATNAPAGADPRDESGNGTLIWIGALLVAVGVLALSVLVVGARRTPVAVSHPHPAESQGERTQPTFASPTFAQPVPAERTFGEQTFAAPVPPGSSSRTFSEEPPSAPEQASEESVSGPDAAAVLLRRPSADGAVRLGSGGLLVGISASSRPAPPPSATEKSDNPDATAGTDAASDPEAVLRAAPEEAATAGDTVSHPDAARESGVAPAGPLPVTGNRMPEVAARAAETAETRDAARKAGVAPAGPPPALPVAGDRMPEVREMLDAGFGPVEVRLIGATRPQDTPAYVWLADGEPAPPAAVPLVLGRRDGWRLHVDLARTPDVLTIVGPEADCRRQAAALARSLHDSGVGVMVVGDTLGDETVPGVRRATEFPAPAAGPRVVICTTVPAHARRPAAVSGGRTVPLVVGAVPAARWSIQLR